MHKTVSSLVSGSVLAAALAVAPVMVQAPASAATPGCVTKAEFHKVTHGMSRKRVKRIFGTDGKQSFFFTGYQSRDYKTCVDPKWSEVSVDYKKRHGVWRVYSKMAIWL